MNNNQGLLRELREYVKMSDDEIKLLMGNPGSSNYNYIAAEILNDYTISESEPYKPKRKVKFLGKL